MKNSVALDATYHYYYTGWRLAETRNGSGNVLKQQVWGLSYIDELVQTSLNHDPTDTTEDDCEFDYYALQDAHFNLLGMYGLDETGREALFDYFPMAGPENWVVADVFSQYGKLVERYEYTPYGERTVYFSAGGNDPDAMSPTGMSRRWTAGAATGYDWTLDSTAQPYGLNDIGHQGLMHDEETGLVYNRARMLSPGLGRFTSPDVLVYVDGMNYYNYLGSNPLIRLDPSGLVWHHLLSQKNFYPGDSESTINKLGMKLSDGIDIHSEKYGWELTPDDHRPLHKKTPSRPDWNTSQKEWLEELDDQGIDEITEEMLDEHIEDMKKKYGLTCPKGKPKIGEPAKGDYPNQSSAKSKLKNKGRLLRILAPIAAIFGYAEARSAGADHLTAAGVGALDGVNPIPVSAMEIGDAARSAQESSMQATRDQAQRGNNRRIQRYMDVGFSLSEAESMVGN